MKSKEIFNRSILKINSNKSLSANFKHKLNATLQILNDDKKHFFIEKGKYLITTDKISECIQNYHNDSLQEHSEVTRTLQLIRQSCKFTDMKQHVKKYIKKCQCCQKNKHSTHTKYEYLQQEISTYKS